jgi:hypothetical protein
MQVNKRNRSALRADKYWASTHLRQMLMRQRPLTIIKNNIKTVHGNSVNTFQKTKENKHE